MRNTFVKRSLLAAILLAGFCAAHAEDDPLQDPSVQKTLRAMASSSTFYHPDQFGEFNGMRYYAHHKFKDALKYFEVGAYYGDKLSQLSIGLMHLNGEGVPKDAANASAWLDLAAERGYPDFVATRDRVKAGLTPQQLAQAAKLHETLAAKYADAVAKPRMVVQLRQGQMATTGSRTGFDSGARQVNNTAACGPSIAVGGDEAPSAGCGGDATNAKSRWDPKAYFASRDAEYKAIVSVGKIEETTQVPVSADAAAKPVEQR